MHVDRFALTSNNISYGAFGEAMSYWSFFPTGNAATGCIPVWGFGTVVESRTENVAVGERFYGYYPMADAVVLHPVASNAQRFIDGAPHRRDLHSVYNQYLRCSSDPLYRPEDENVLALYRPLFPTSFLIDDFLADNGFFGANAMLLSSASSKTAYGTAFQLAKRPGVEVIALTSPANVAFCESLGCYSRVVTYEQLDAIAADTACVYVDFAGSANLRQRIHARFDQLRYNCSIGGTHVDDLAAKGSARDLPGPRPLLFFAPSQVKKRITDWGEEGFGKQLVHAWRDFTQQVTGAKTPWLIAQRHAGQAAVQAAYQEVLAGKGDPRTGHILQP
jgi:hypothetical protein